ncbi:thioesterase family protein [Echinimonas agarilytica]|uniref:Thioesterase family protein n=1 Tax=Echinimonas agarilytica TaxID=1215918 RepID=A0AA42B6B9_9GAMM|nr:thioesterase family protein [Echinimonas agarilytica]MCM2678266.1 thioesterase family protein [Echinimonas agarilytica]
MSLVKPSTMIHEVAELFHNGMPFDKVIGLRVERCEPEGATLSFDAKPELIGNPIHQILHGGVISTALDVAGAAVTFAAALNRMPEMPKQEMYDRLGRMSTIDLRIDYLRPGRGQVFTATSHIIRAGSKVAVARMELHNEDGTHIAFGTGTYMVG